MDQSKSADQAGRAVEGVYSAHFLSNADRYGEGIVVVDGGKIHGGDLDYVYIGKYSLSNNEFSASLDVSKRRSGTTARWVSGCRRRTGSASRCRR